MLPDTACDVNWRDISTEPQYNRDYAKGLRVSRVDYEWNYDRYFILIKRIPHTSEYIYECTKNTLKVNNWCNPKYGIREIIIGPFTSTKDDIIVDGMTMCLRNNAIFPPKGILVSNMSRGIHGYTINTSSSPKTDFHNDTESDSDDDDDDGLCAIFKDSETLKRILSKEIESFDDLGKDGKSSVSIAKFKTSPKEEILVIDTPNSDLTHLDGKEWDINTLIENILTFDRHLDQTRKQEKIATRIAEALRNATKLKRDLCVTSYLECKYNSFTYEDRRNPTTSGIVVYIGMYNLNECKNGVFFKNAGPQSDWKILKNKSHVSTVWTNSVHDCFPITTGKENHILDQSYNPKHHSFASDASYETYLKQMDRYKSKIRKPLIILDSDCNQSTFQNEYYHKLDEHIMSPALEFLGFVGKQDNQQIEIKTYAKRVSCLDPKYMSVYEIGITYNSYVDVPINYPVVHALLEKAANPPSSTTAGGAAERAAMKSIFPTLDTDTQKIKIPVHLIKLMSHWQK